MIFAIFVKSQVTVYNWKELAGRPPGYDSESSVYDSIYYDFRCETSGYFFYVRVPKSKADIRIKDSFLFDSQDKKETSVSVCCDSIKQEERYLIARYPIKKMDYRTIKRYGVKRFVLIAKNALIDRYLEAKKTEEIESILRTL